MKCYYVRVPNSPLDQPCIIGTVIMDDEAHETPLKAVLNSHIHIPYGFLPHGHGWYETTPMFDKVQPIGLVNAGEDTPITGFARTIAGTFPHCVMIGDKVKIYDRENCRGSVKDTVVLETTIGELLGNALNAEEPNVLVRELTAEEHAAAQQIVEFYNSQKPAMVLVGI